jgi:exonuclease III
MLSAPRGALFVCHHPSFARGYMRDLMRQHGREDLILTWPEDLRHHRGRRLSGIRIDHHVADVRMSAREWETLMLLYINSQRP